MTTRTVGHVARMAGLTVRTLHHYDEIGLLTPSERGDNGYRRYTDEDLERLREILVYRELGLPLDEIQTIVDEQQDASVALLNERAQLAERIDRLRSISDMIDTTIERKRQGVTMTPEEKLAVFGDFDPAEHQAEAEQRWGSSEAYRQSARRTAAYKKDDWERINAEAAGIYERFASLAQQATEPGSAEAQQLVDEHRAHISRWFYECTPEIHAGLGQMYQHDQRFADAIDKSGNGVAQYMSAAIAERYGD